MERPASHTPPAHRFFVPPTAIDGGRVVLPQAAARQLSRVLRTRPGDQIVVLDDTGWEYVVTLDAVTGRRVEGSISARARNQAEPPVAVTLYQALLKADRLEFVFQKGTELGVRRFVPVISSRSVPRAREEGWGVARLARWRKIVTEAAEQSRRGRLPAVDAPVAFSGACDSVHGLALIPWERETGLGLRAFLAHARATGAASGGLSLFIGPEGGFTDAEIEYALGRGIVPVSLGARILRAETAGLVSVALALYELGGLGL